MPIDFNGVDDKVRVTVNVREYIAV